MSEDTKSSKRKVNEWIKHCQEVKSKNPNMPYKDILHLAKESYTPVKKEEKTKPTKKKRKKLDPDDEGDTGEQPEQ